MALPLLIERPSCLDGIPSWLEDFLSRCPRSPNGVHQWLCSAAHRTHPYLGEEDQIPVLRWAMRNCGRPPGRNEIQNTVRNVRARREHGWIDRAFSWPAVTYSEIDRIVRHGITHSQLKAHSPWIGQRQTRRWLKELFPDNPLICLAQGTPAEMDSGSPAFAWHTRRRDSWCSRRYRLSFFSFIVPSPAKYTWGWTQDRRRSTRCNEMFPARRYLVVEWDFSLLNRDGTKETQWAFWIRAWEKAGRSIQDASSALIWHLTEYAPLTIVIWSAGKSLQAWFNVAGQPERLVYDFFSYAVGLGADSMTWTKCQLVRTPAAIRSNEKRQQVDYFNSSHVPRI